MTAKLLSWRALLGLELATLGKQKMRAGVEKRVVEKEDGKADRVETP